MNNIGEAIEAIQDYLPSRQTKSIDEMLQEALQDDTIKKFVEENNISEETINTFRSTLIIYHQRKQAGEDLALNFSGAYRGDIIEVVEIKQPYKPKKRAKLETDLITSSLRGLYFKDLERDEYNDKLIASFERLVSNYSEIDTKKGVWVHGNFGRGKTYILGALANELFANYVDVTFISPKTFIDQYMSLPFADKEAYLKKVAEVEVLIMDDIGQEYATEFSVKVIYELMAIRYANNRLTFASSNLTIDEYVQSLSKANAMDAGRLNERLKHLCTQYKLDGNNRR